MVNHVTIMVSINFNKVLYMKVLSVDDVANIIAQHGFNNFILDLVKYLKQDFTRWNEFNKTPRHALHVIGGVIELMPICDNKYYTFKYVNGHPKNPLSGKQTVVATGQLSQVGDGYPLMLSEMTTLTALRTAATSILATDLLARKDSHTVAIIGTGAQSEFQTLAHTLVRNIKTVRYFDVDQLAMQKYHLNLLDSGLELIACNSAKEAVQGADIIIVCTACKGHVNVILNEWLSDGVHINALGGDCPGKTELELDILYRSKIVVEFMEQSLIEGEIQRLEQGVANKIVHSELWQIINGDKSGRENDTEITLFDSVGFAIEDYSVLRLAYDLANQYNLGQDLELIPPLTDPKNLFSVINNTLDTQLKVY